MPSSTPTPSGSYRDPRREIITFEASTGRYQITRQQRYRLAIMHRLTEAEARRLAYGAVAISGPLWRAPTKSNGFTADELFDRFNADGSAKTRRPGLPRTAGAAVAVR